MSAALAIAILLCGLASTGVMRESIIVKGKSYFNALPAVCHAP
jgi:hypothetical protein